MMTALGALLLARSEPEEAEAVLRQGLEIQQATLPADHWRLAVARSELGACLTALGRFSEAEPLTVDGYRRLTETHGPDHARTSSALEWVVELYVAWDRPEEAEAYRTRRSG